MFHLFDLNITELLSELLSQFISAAPNFVGAMIIAVVGWIIAKVIAKALKTILKKVGIDKLGDKLNEIEMVSKANMEIKLSTVFSKVVYYFLLLFFFVAAADVLNMPAVSQLVMDIFNFIPNLIVALIILILGLLIAEALRSVVHTACVSLGIPSANLISSFLFYFLFINILIVALTQAKINTEFLAQNISLIIGGAVLAFAIGYGLASKDIVANFLASFYSKGLFEVGDKISFDGSEGTVVAVDKSSLTLDTGTSRIVIPLSKVMKDKIEIHK